MADDVPPIPANFGFRYIVWVTCWAIYDNFLTLLSATQLALAVLVTNKDLFSDATFTRLTLANAVLLVLVAQFKKRLPIEKPAALLRPPPPVDPAQPSKATK